MFSVLMPVYHKDNPVYFRAALVPQLPYFDEIVLVKDAPPRRPNGSALRRRNPFNHMTVCFRRDFIRAIGGYPAIALKEDYALWAKAIARGARVANLPQVLVRARAGSELVLRRGGLRYARSELALQALLWREGGQSAWSSLLAGCARAAVFAVPPVLRQFVYRRASRSKGT